MTPGAFPTDPERLNAIARAIDATVAGLDRLDVTLARLEERTPVSGEVYAPSPPAPSEAFCRLDTAAGMVRLLVDDLADHVYRLGGRS